ncbi:MAG TPA: hypothetical protein VK151_09430 [Fluviicola sp.]|nr:hypothetical protein [Fluviicola sp.]
MEEKRVALVIGAKYFVSGELCTLLHKGECYYVLFGVGKSYHLESYSNTEELQNPIFNLRNFQYSIKDYTLETGDYCKDFPRHVAARILKADTPLVQSTHIDMAMENNLLFLFAGRTLGWKTDVLTLSKEYSWGEFYNRYKNLLLTYEADYFR